MIVKSENRILFHHSNGKNEPVLATNTCEIFYREQKSIKMHYKKPLNDYRKAVICKVFLEPAIITCFQILAISIFSSLIGGWSELILLACRNKDKRMATSIHLLLFK